MLTGVLAVFLAAEASSQLNKANNQPPAEQWFLRPSVMPTDVFDLPFFDEHRQGNRIDVAKAQAALEDLSDKNLLLAQNLFDVLAWRGFIALNWPAKSDGEPDESKGFADDKTPKVWEYWTTSAQVFLPHGERPIWKPAIGREAADHFKAGWRQSATVDQGRQAFSGPLVDQNGHWVHYHALMNRREFDYIVGNELYNLEGQESYTRKHAIDFPLNDDTQNGAIEIKLAWKVLTEREVTSGRFLIRRLPIVQYKPLGAQSETEVPLAHKTGKSSDSGRPTEVIQTLGLVGMHIAMRTRSSPQWVWATFEQIDNTRIDQESGDQVHRLPQRPSFANPDDPTALVNANLLPVYNAGLASNGQPIQDWDETKPLPPVEVLRVVPPAPSTAKINRMAQRFLAERSSVLRYYELIGTQWPKHPLSPAVPGGQGSAPESIIRKTPGEVVPVYLINSTMETYFQKGLQNAGSLEQDDRVPLSIDTTSVFGTESCVGCHYSAGACIGFRKDLTGQYLRDANGRKVPIYGENANDGRTGNANFSWMLQIETKSKEEGNQAPH